MKKPVILILALIAALVVVVAPSLAQEQQIEISTAYQGATQDGLARMAADFDWDSFRENLENDLTRIELPIHKAPIPAHNLAEASRYSPDVLQQSWHTTLSDASSSDPTVVDIKQSFDGTSDDDNASVLGFRVVPPDTNGDVGKKFYAQMNNLVFEIFDKKTGSSVLGPLPNTIFWTNTGSVCEFFNDGDPVVLYDHDAERWIFTQFAIFEFIPGPNFFVSHQCFAVSQTSDPTGAYFLYDFVYSVPTFGGIAALNDYPKVTVWPNGYYISVNEFEFFPGFGFFFVGATAGVVDRQAMLAGLPAGGIKFFVANSATAFHFSLQPSHWEGSKAPASAANTFIQAFDDETWGSGGADGPDGYWHWELTADFTTPSFSFVDKGLIPSATFDSNLCNFADCVPQPPPAGAADVLDTLSQFTMFRAAYRNFGLGSDDDDSDDDDGDSDDGGHETIVISHSVDVGGDVAGVRWAELRNTGGGYSVHQAGTYAPADGENRWMPSIAINEEGDIAIGYSVSSTGTFPSVRVVGRQEDDPLGVMGVEGQCQAGGGSQLGSANRWGDYSSMSVDPRNDETFWYTQEYYANNGSFDFKTRVCSFDVDDDSDSGSD